MVRSYHYLLGPIGAFVAVGVLIVLSRWAFTGPRPRRCHRTAGGRRDYGLLVPVAVVGRRDDAESARQVLAAAGIRCTLARVEPTVDRPRGAFHLLVFAEAESRARDVLTGSDH